MSSPADGAPDAPDTRARFALRNDIRIEDVSDVEIGPSRGVISAYTPPSCFDEWFDGAFARYEDAKSGIAACMDLISSDFRAADIRSVMRQAWNAALSGSVPAVTRENEIAKQVADGEEVIDALAGVRHDTQRIEAAMNTEKDGLDLDAIKTRYDAAFMETSGGVRYRERLTKGPRRGGLDEDHCPAYDHFVARAPDDIPALIGEIVRLRSEIAALRESQEIADGRAVGTITNLVEEINRLRTDLAALRGRVASSLYNIDMLRDEGFTTKQIYGLRGMLDVILTGESRGLNGEEGA